MTAELRRNLILALVGLAGGFGLIVALFGSAELLKRPLTSDGLGGPHNAPSVSTGKPDGSGAPALSGEGSPTVPSSQAEMAPKADASKGAESAADAKTTDSKSSGDAKTLSDAKAPSFDLVRVEPTGEAVVAGRGLPNTVVEMLVNGKPVAKALADPNGQFALVPPALAPGNSEIVLRLTDPQGRETRSPQSVAVVVSPDRKTRPLVALSSPDGPTVVLSQPEAVGALPDKTTDAPSAGSSPKLAVAQPGADKTPARADGGKAPAGATGADRTAPGQTSGATADASAAKRPALKIVSIDAQVGGRLYVSGQATPGATVRLYLNDTLVAPASVGADGKVVFTIGKGVAPGDYRARIDQVDPVTGKVRTRAEVSFSVPESTARVAAREPAGEAPRASTGSATTAVPPPGLKPEARSRHAGQPDREAGPMASNAPKQGSGDAGPSATAPQADGLAAAVDARRPNQSTAHAARPAEPSAASPANALAAASATAETPSAETGSAFVAEIATARITRGDNLWQISRKAYGSGRRYTVIYDANQGQIRDPDRIFPGQIFVLPKDEKGGRG